MLRAGGLRPPQRLGLAELDELHSRLKAAFEYAITPKGNLTLHGGRDDHVDSLALAARPLTRPRGKPGAMRLSVPRGRPGPRWNWERRP